MQRPLAPWWLPLSILLFGSGLTGLSAVEKVRFDGRPEFRVDEYPFAVLVEDMNGDGREDVVSLGALNTVSVVLLGDGMGQAGRFEVKTSDGPVAFVPLQITGDGPDLAVLCAGEMRVDLLINHGSGNLTRGAVLPLDSRPVSAAAADFNGDGHDDLAVATTAPQVELYLGSQHGTLLHAGSVPVGTDPVAMEAYPTGDGSVEIAVLSDATAKLTILRWNGSSFTSVVHDAPSGPIALDSGDFNGDGRTDLALVSRSIASVFVWAREEDGSWNQETPYPLPFFPLRITCPDLDRDGISDLLVINSLPAVEPPYGIASFRRVVDGTIGGPTFLPRGIVEIPNVSTGLAAGELSGDGVIDAVTTSELSGTVAVFEGRGDGTFKTTDKLPDFQREGRSPVLHDVDGDGRPDLLLANFATGSVLLYDGKSMDATAPVTIPSVAFVDQVAAGDIDGDGSIDLATSSFTSARIGIHLATSPSRLGLSSQFGVGQGITDLLLHDLEGDGDADLITLHQFSAKVIVWESQGNGLFQRKQEVSLNGTYPHAFHGRDLDGDGNLDLAVVSYTAGAVEIVPGLRGGRFDLAYPFTLPSSPISVTSGDANGDGSLDLLVAHRYDRSVSILHATGDLVYGAASSFRVDGEPFFVATGDFLLRGRDDLAVLFRGSALGVFPREGEGFASEAVLTGLSATESGLAIGDIDGDLLPDVATGTSVLLNRSLPSERLALHGTVNAGNGPVTDVLFVNGTAGDEDRRLTISRHEDIAIVLGEPPAATGSVSYALYAVLGDPTPGRSLPAFVGNPAVTLPIDGADPGRVVVLANSFTGIRFIRAGGPPRLSREKAPDAMFLPARAGLRGTVTLQGLIVDPGSRSPRGVSLTNGVVVDIE